MPRRPVELPDNLPDCHAIILRQTERIEELEARVDELTTQVKELMAEVSRRGALPGQTWFSVFNGVESEGGACVTLRLRSLDHAPAATSTIPGGDLPYRHAR